MHTKNNTIERYGQSTKFSGDRYTKDNQGAASNSGREIQIIDWKPRIKNTLCGSFGVILPSGMIIHNLMLHSKDGSRWIGLPAREWTDSTGKKQYARFIEFVDRATADDFRDALLQALDAYLGVR